MIADIMTKPLQGKGFQKFRDVLMGSVPMWYDTVCMYVCQSLTGSVYLSHGYKVHCRSVLAEVNIYCIQIGINTIMKGKWILGSSDSGDLLSWILDHGFGSMEKVSLVKNSHGQTASKIAHSNSSLF